MNNSSNDTPAPATAPTPAPVTPIAVAHAQHSMSACDKLTMETMMNVEAYSKYMNRRSQAAGLRGGPDTSERKFYRRRIIDTTKEMLRDSKYVSDSTVSGAFNAYVSACIMHFKFIDLADTIQDEYSELSVVENGSGAAKADDDPEDAAETVMKMNKLCFNPKVEESKSVKIRTPHMNAIERLFVSKPNQPEAESFTAANAANSAITANTTDKDIPSPKISTIPRTKDVNIKDAQFKTKGIKPKLKNKSGREPDSTT